MRFSLRRRPADPLSFWVPDSPNVRLSLPWHGVASWADMHAYVTAVIKENTTPDEWYHPPEKIARSILLSLCHRLKIEPVGAFEHGPVTTTQEIIEVHNDDD